MKAFNRWLALVTCTVAAAACAVAPKEPVSVDERLAGRGYRVAERVDRITNFRLNGWTYLDERHVILAAGVRDRYLVTLKSTCYDLGHAMDIAYTTTVGSLTDTDRLIVEGGGAFNNECLIHRLHRLERVESNTEKR
jgi:hypothetical protein